MGGHITNSTEVYIREQTNSINVIQTNGDATLRYTGIDGTPAPDGIIDTTELDILYSRSSFFPPLSFIPVFKTPTRFTASNGEIPSPSDLTYSKDLQELLPVWDKLRASTEQKYALALNEHSYEKAIQQAALALQANHCISRVHLEDVNTITTFKSEGCSDTWVTTLAGPVQMVTVDSTLKYIQIQFDGLTLYLHKQAPLAAPFNSVQDDSNNNVAQRQ